MVSLWDGQNFVHSAGCSWCCAFEPLPCQLTECTLSQQWLLQQQQPLLPPCAQLGLDLRTTVQLVAQWYASLLSTAAADLSANMSCIYGLHKSEAQSRV